MSENLYLYTLSTFRELILSALQIAGAKRIVEVGSEYGKFTQELCAYARHAGGKLTSIDPYPQKAALEFVEAHRGQLYFDFIQKTSHEALGECKDADAFIIDGDHNYYTVLGELELIHKTRGDAPWLVFQHDVCWPCGRRDMYYHPENIPAEHRQPYTSAKGIIFEQPGVTDRGMHTDGQIAYALEEGGPRNGVLTAIEDFLAKHPELKFEVIPGILGLGVIYSKKAAWGKKLTALFAPLANNPLIDRMERNRLQLQMRVCELEHQIYSLTHAAPAPAPQPAAPQLSPEALRRQAENLFQHQDWLEAAKFYQVLIRQTPNDANLWQKRIECFSQAGQKVMVKLLFKDAVREHPEWNERLARYSPENGTTKISFAASMSN